MSLPRRVVADPLAGKEVERPDNTPLSLLREHFSAYQLALKTRLPVYLSARTALWGGAVVGLFVAMVVTGGEENTVALGCLALTMLFVMLPWDVYRLIVVLQRGHELPELHE